MFNKRIAFTALLFHLLLFLWSSASRVYAFESAAKYAILADFDTGTILYEKDAESPMVPSSMTKIMTTYLIFRELDSGRLKLTDKFNVSQKAFSIQGSRMFLPTGTDVNIEDLLRGIIVQSGNDACITAAEGIAGSESLFVEQMNNTAKSLGMNDTKFVNSSGWPDPQQLTTARDLAILSRALIRDFPQYYPYHAERHFTYNRISQPNRNSLLSIPGVDGIKTGHTDTGGYGIVFSTKRHGYRLIGVVNGLNSARQRHEAASELLAYGFGRFTRHLLYRRGEVVARSAVAYGEEIYVPVAIDSDLSVFFNKGEKKLDTAKVEIEFHIKHNLKAPINAGDDLGFVLVRQALLDGKEAKLPLIAARSVAKAGFIDQLAQNLARFYSSGADGEAEDGDDKSSSAPSPAAAKK